MDNESVCENCGEPAEYNSEICLCADCEKASGQSEKEDNHSVNCYFCGELVDERECIPADPYNKNDGGSICPSCIDKKDEEYVNGGGNKCLYCGSVDIEGSRVQTDGTGAWQEVSCDDCGKDWTDIYKMIGVER